MKKIRVLGICLLTVLLTFPVLSQNTSNNAGFLNLNDGEVIDDEDFDDIVSPIDFDDLLLEGFSIFGVNSVIVIINDSNQGSAQIDNGFWEEEVRVSPGINEAFLNVGCNQDCSPISSITPPINFTYVRRFEDRQFEATLQSNQNDIEIDWGESEGYVPRNTTFYYRLFRNTEPTPAGGTFITPWTTQRLFADTSDKDPGVTYYYWVDVALNDSGLNNSGISDNEFQVVTIPDAPPTIVCPPDIITQSDLGKLFASGIDLGMPVVDDDLGIADVNNNAPTTFPIGETAVIWTVIDTSGNMSSCSQLVTVAPCVGTITTFDGESWDNGLPTQTDIAVIDGDYVTDLEGNLDVCSCEITENTSVIVSDNTFLRTRSDINIQGHLIVENEGNIIQLDDLSQSINEGLVEVHKTTPLLEPRDFILLSSPMNGESRSGVYGDANRVFEINSELFDPDLETLGTNGITFLDRDGDYFSPAANLNAAASYLVFPQAVTATNSISYNHNYTQGTLNNGIINASLVYNGPGAQNNFNLMGNPYPSAIDTGQLILTNDAINEVYFWEHITQPNENLPGFNTSNFDMNDVSIRNLTGGIASANGGTAPGPYMASGQGFGVLAQQDAIGSDLTFNNAMRVTGNNTTLRSAEDLERLTLKLESNSYSLKSTMLIGFVSEATPLFDPGFDSKRLDTTIGLFSILDTGEQLVIQGREAFDPGIEISMGIISDIQETESYTISIERIEGVGLIGNDIFLIDNFLNTTVNLKEEKYTFSTTGKIQGNRFTLTFQNVRKYFDSDDEFGKNMIVNLYPNPVREKLKIDVENSSLQSATIFNLKGHSIYSENFKDKTNLSIDTSFLGRGVYIIKLFTANDVIIKRFFVE